ncbi:MAG: tRNA (adenosine(37)-N6)-dimethylallyltransferase MiaA [Candidatus Limivicinus sp.]|jgi:tRNA dimethylallyltransferase
MPEKVIVVAGPTAAGKTELAIELAEEFRGEIVSADSMQIYKGMDIGTAKADAEERARVPHHMLDAASPEENYSVARYVEEAARCCEDILSRGRIPVITGGTGLYIDSLISGRDFAEAGGEKELRDELSKQYERLGGEKMLRILAEFDPERAAKLNSGDRRRIIRAIEIYRLTGETITEHDARTKALPPRYDAAYIVLSFEKREKLYSRIDERVDKMIEKGLFGEVQGLLDMGISPESTAMQAIGYKEAVWALQGKLTKSEAAALIKQASRRYAKRQLTWFRRREDALWIYRGEEPDFEAARQLSREFLHSRGIS